MNATNEVKHTPGPWTSGHVKGSSVYDLIGPDITGRGREVVGSFHATQYPNEINDSNARLFAAALELLYALEDLIQRCELPNGGLDQSPTHEGLTNCNVLAKARAALAKATGTPN